MKQSLKILSPTFDVASDGLSGNSVGSGFAWRQGSGLTIGHYLWFPVKVGGVPGTVYATLANKRKSNERGTGSWKV